MPVRLTTHGGISPVESFDGRYLYYSKYEKKGVWRMPLQAGGEEREVFSEMDPGGWPNWALSAEGIYFLKFGKFPHTDLAFFDFADGKTYVVWSLEKKTGWGLSLSADGKSLVYLQDQFAESNLMLVRNFR